MNKIINKAVSIFIIFSLVLGLNVMNSLIVANAEEYVIDVANEKYGTTITAVPHTDKNTGEYSGGEAGDVNTLITDDGGMYAFGWNGNAASPYGYIQLHHK